MDNCYNQDEVRVETKTRPSVPDKLQGRIAPGAGKLVTIGRKTLKLGEHLVAMGLIDQATLDRALEQQKVSRGKLGQILVDMGVADDRSIAEALATQLKIPLVELTPQNISAQAIALVPAEFATKHAAIPLRITEKGMVVAFANPLALDVIDELSFITGKRIEAVIATSGDINEALTRHYKIPLAKQVSSPPPKGGAALEIIRRHEKADRDEEGVDLKKLENLAEIAPVVRFLNAILTDAIRQRASDIHVEPGKTAVIIRYRIDGILQEAMKTEPHTLATLVSRIKIIADMDISVRRQPQDGKAQVRLNDKAYDLRISTMPTTFGEKVTIRILDSAMAGIGLKDIGFSSENYGYMAEAIESPQGIVLVTGPTGSGKSSTLYACLNHLKSPEVNIITLEDPVEYDMAGVTQVSINLKAGMTFASGLRTVLRQDPDIVMIGEIRDGETAEIACKASQTGHFVLSTLHTNDAPSAIIRLMDLGVEAFMISATIRAVVGQRLVRKICEHCKVPVAVPTAYARKIATYLKGHPKAIFWQGSGCPRCRSTGYSGRVAIHEVMVMTPEIREALAPGISSFALKKIAGMSGYRSLTLDGLDKARDGLTSIEEIFRVAPPEIDTTEIKATDVAGNGKGDGAKDVADDVIDLVTAASDKNETPKKLLVVDDDAMARRILQATLEKSGFQVTAAVNGIDALKKVLAEKPDMILTDYLMPEMDGLLLVRTLKNRPETRDIPIIMLTSKDEAESEIELMEAGVDDYLTKPVNAQRLLARMGRLLK